VVILLHSCFIDLKDCTVHGFVVFFPIRYLLRLAAFASGSRYYAALGRWQQVQDNRKVHGKFCLPRAADWEGKVAVKADGGSGLPFNFAK
jgi:hypothetical protein